MTDACACVSRRTTANSRRIAEANTAFFASESWHRLQIVTPLTGTYRAAHLVQTTGTIGPAREQTRRAGGDQLLVRCAVDSNMQIRGLATTSPAGGVWHATQGRDTGRQGGLGPNILAARVGADYVSRLTNLREQTPWWTSWRRPFWRPSSSASRQAARVIRHGTWYLVRRGHARYGMTLELQETDKEAGRQSRMDFGQVGG